VKVTFAIPLMNPSGCAHINEDGETIYANRATLDIYGYDSIEALKQISVKERYNSSDLC